MNTDGRQNQRLAAMGLGRWRLRVPPPATVERPARVVQQPAAAIALVAVDFGVAALELQPQDPRGDLLIKILAAVKQPLDRFAIVETGSPHQASQMVPVAPVFWFGDHLLHGCALCLPSLDAMLADVAAKRWAWNKLKPWIKRLEPAA